MPVPRDIGKPDTPVRAIVFSGGMVETVMQLGVVHALLVTRAVRPDVVVGISAGAINAVALAEVLQAGETVPDKRLHAQIIRFRQILDAYRRAPGEIIDALLPDPFQVEAQRPLEPLRLPIQQQVERNGRLEAVRSRAGMINLYNQLLDMRMSIGTFARAVRVLLGFQAAGEIRARGAWRAMVIDQCIQGWVVLGSNLFRLAPLVPDLVAVLLGFKRPEERGASAAEIIFHGDVIPRARKFFSYAASLIGLAALWLAISAVVVLAPAAVAHALALLIPGLVGHRGLVTAFSYLAVALAVLGLIQHRPAHGRWRALFVGLARAVPYFATFVVLVIRWTVLLAIPVLALWLLLWLAVHKFELRATAAAWQAAVQQWWQAAVEQWWFPAYLVLLALCAGFIVWRRYFAQPPARPFWARLLERYELHDSLFSSYPLRQLFVRLFDPRYYGGTQIQDAVERALSDDDSPARQNIAGKALQDYRLPRVGLTVADVSTGQLHFLDPAVRVVDGLLAAMAMVPLFPPVPIDGTLCVDGTNISNEPTRALLDFLRERLEPQATVLHIYNVAALPVSGRGLTGAPEPHESELVVIAQRAMQLQRYRDATLERRLTELYTKSIPGDRILYPAPDPDSAEPAPKQYVRAWVHAIEPDRPLELTQRIFEAESTERRRDLITETVADGCRAALEVMIQPAIEEVRAEKGAAVPDKAERDERPVLPCRLAVQKHLKIADAGLPGSEAGDDHGPGLSEVCRVCAIRREATLEGRRTYLNPGSLRVPPQHFHQPRWPSEEQKELVGEADFDVTKKTGEFARTPAADAPGWKWPLDRGAELGTQRPLINLLFSGGVFRGVYQIGVLNALSEVQLRPDVVAGASVGSITAAMVARVLLEDSDKHKRQQRIAELAATYLALDRLILTDRLADFVRNLTLRAAATRLSLRQADSGFRRYDRPGRGQFEQELRVVLAGLERLFYISPFEVKDLVEAIRDRRTDQIYNLVRRYLQEWLDRSGIETEALGAEPLALLIREHVIAGLAGDAEPTQVPFDVFLKDGLCLLATTTNLTQGRLEILGDDQIWAHTKLTLLDSLLASSAFPGVFRPRESWELMPATKDEDQFIDGGVIDNLPLDAVAEFLHRAAVGGKIEPRPAKGPHLLFSASLETELTQLRAPQIAALQGNWPALFRRTRQLGYNQKLAVYAATQRDLRAIHEYTVAHGGSPAWTPLDLEVVTVRPKWLCGTFAFHPMLGFRRAKQAASIAHGCATTLAELGALPKDPKTKEWASAWGISLDRLPPVDAEQLVPRDHGPNKCWFRPDVDCPFSSVQLAGLKLEEHTAKQLESIYHACGRVETHQAK
ncbi:MAG TPA: patatin-like phospholipase family protein [Gemmatimonadales bacterium]|nr:patatin-like phospholipase family protein [Gemmatimonadales bacterium]